MTAEGILADILRSGVQISAQDGKLALRAPKGALSPDLSAQIQAYKAELIALMRPGAKYSRMSSAQARLWFLHLLDPESRAYNMPAAAMKLHGQLDAAALESSLNAIIERHESLRTTFESVGGQATQIISPFTQKHWERIDLTALSPDEREAELAKKMREAAACAFDLKTGPLFRAILIKLAQEEHAILLPMHHIISDGWSLTLLFNELAQCYTHFLEGGNGSPLEAHTHHYADYTNVQHEWFNTEACRHEVIFWKKQLGGELPILQLPTDRPRPAFATSKGDILNRTLRPELITSLKALSQECHATLFMTFLTAYYIFLHRYTGQADIVVGSPVNGRSRPETHGNVGLFVNSLPLRCTLHDSETVTDLLGRVRTIALDAFERQELPFERMVEELDIARDTSHAPIFQTMCVLQNNPKPGRQFGGLRMERLDSHSGSVKLDLVLSLMERITGPVLSLEYNSDLFDAETIGRMMDHFELLLDAMAVNPQAKISQLDFLPQSEKEELLHKFNPGRTPFPDQCTVHALFQEQAAKTPDAPAIVTNSTTMSYGQLNARANEIAHLLQQKGLQPNDKVAVLLLKAPDTIASILAILKAGACYVPLDPEYPKSRLQFMFDEVQPTLILCQSEFLESLPNTNSKIVELDKIQSEIAIQSDINLAELSSPDDPAYIIFTSGSTGTPKGVVLAHRGLCNLVNGYMGRLCRDTDCRQLQFASFSFDASIAEIFTTLCNGAALVVAPREEMLDPADLTRLMQRLRVSLVTLPPSLLQMLKPDALADLRQLIVAGERCPAGLLEKWMADRKVYNAYGPTEATVCATVYLCKGEYPQGPPIGAPIENVHVYVLDSQLNLVPIGVPGELCISSPGLALEYLHQQELSRESFVSNPFESGQRIYRSGDIVRWHRGGNLEFIGRKDGQVKVRGFRIEVREIENALQQHPEIVQCAVTTFPDQSGGSRLVAYIVSQNHPNTADLRMYLAERLPHYMIPAHFVPLDALPLSPNGKVNRAALPKAHTLASTTDDITHTPTEAAIARIWCAALELERVGLHENFLDCGGHSLLAVRVMQRVQEEFQMEAPLRWIFESPTVAALAARIDAAKAPAPANIPGENTATTTQLPDVLITLRPGTKKPALFVFAPAGGTVYPYYPIAHAMGPEQPVYALQDPAMEGLRKPYKSIEGMATHYVNAIKFIQPQGPYHICGWSLGAVIGFEVAQQFAAQGDKVGLVALIEPGKALAKNKGTLRGWLLNQRATLGMRIAVGISSIEASRDALYLMLAPKKNRSANPLATLRNIGGDAIWRLLLKNAHIGEVVSDDERMLLIKQPGALSFLPIARANVKAARKYWPKPYSGPLVLFRGSTLPEENDPVIADWGRLGASLEVNTIEGDHFSLTRNPASTEIANIMAAHIKTFAEDDT